ncbi:MAG: hypothetical protein HY053_02555 [Proteobacteria bacterium]|nr:hypothetical protein [Pseudomonadota bacterium]
MASFSHSSSQAWLSAGSQATGKSYLTGHLKKLGIFPSSTVFIDCDELALSRPKHRGLIKSLLGQDAELYLANPLTPLPRDLSDSEIERLRQSFSDHAFNLAKATLAQARECLAKQQGFVFAGTMASDSGIQFAAEIKEHGGQLIFFVCLSPLERQLSRNRQRIGVSSEESLIRKRNSLFPNLEIMLQQADGFFLFWNPDNDASPQLAAYNGAAALTPKALRLSDTLWKQDGNEDTITLVSSAVMAEVLADTAKTHPDCARLLAAHFRLPIPRNFAHAVAPPAALAELAIAK